MEAQFKDFQVQMNKHMVEEEASFNEMKESLKEIVGHIDAAQKENEQLMDKVRFDIMACIDKEYASKLDVEKNLTSLRRSMLDDIKVEKRRSMKELWLLILGFSVAMALFGWLYINVLSRAVVHITGA